jgi:hypothetical protein
MNLVILLVAEERDDEAIARIRALRSKPGYEARYDCLTGDLLVTILRQVEEGRETIRDCEARGGELGQLHRAVLDGRFKGLED